MGERAKYSSVALSPDQLWVAAQEGYPAQRIRIYNLQSGAGRRLTSLDGSEGPPLWSLDSRAVYFVHQIGAGSGY